MLTPSTNTWVIKGIRGIYQVTVIRRKEGERILTSFDLLLPGQNNPVRVYNRNEVAIRIATNENNLRDLWEHCSVLNTLEEHFLDNDI